MRLPRNLFTRIAPMNLKMRKCLIINDRTLRFMGRIAEFRHSSINALSASLRLSPGGGTVRDCCRRSSFKHASLRRESSGGIADRSDEQHQTCDYVEGEEDGHLRDRKRVEAKPRRGGHRRCQAETQKEPPPSEA